MNDELFNIVRLINQIVAVGTERKLVTHCLVECALPPLIISIAIPFESLRGELLASKVENAHLLTLL